VVVALVVLSKSSGIGKIDHMPCGSMEAGVGFEREQRTLLGELYGLLGMCIVA